MMVARQFSALPKRWIRWARPASVGIAKMAAQRAAGLGRKRAQLAGVFHGPFRKAVRDAASQANQRLFDAIVACRRGQKAREHVERPAGPRVRRMLPARYQEELLPEVQAIGDSPQPGDRRPIEHPADEPCGMRDRAQEQDGNEARDPHTAERRVERDGECENPGDSEPRRPAQLRAELLTLRRIGQETVSYTHLT